MAEENSDTVNPNLDRGSRPHPTTRSTSTRTIPIFEEMARLGANRRARLTWEYLFNRSTEIRVLAPQEIVRVHQPIPPNPHNSSIESNDPYVNSNTEGAFQAGEGSVVAETSKEKDDVAKGSCNDRDFYKCYICFDLPNDPIVTYCGHLFCWSCIYQWLNVQSNSNECPVCKVKVNVKHVTPIYGGGNNSHVSEAKDSDPKIPARPKARRAKNLKQTFERYPFSSLMEMMVQSVGNTLGLTQDPFRPYDTENARPNARPEQVEIEIITSLLRRLGASQHTRFELTLMGPPEVNNNAGRDSSNQEHTPLVDDASRIHNLVQPNEPDYARHEQDEVTTSLLRMFMTSRGMRVELDFVEPQNDVVDLLHNSNVGRGGRNQEHPPHVGDASKVPDIDSGEYRPPRHRRLN